MKNSKIKIALIGATRQPSGCCGHPTFVKQMVAHLSPYFSLTVFAERGCKADSLQSSQIRKIPFAATGVQGHFYKLASIIYAVFICDVLLILGVSGAFIIPVIQFLAPRKKIVVNVDALLWSDSDRSVFARRFLVMCESAAVRYADEVVADNAAIQKYLLDRYDIQAMLIENGADHSEGRALDIDTFVKYPFVAVDYAFAQADIIPDNNIHLILKAFARQRRLNLVMVGNWEQSEYGRKLYAEYSFNRRIQLLDPISDPQLFDQLRSNAKVYLHSCGGTGQNAPLTEAMFLGLPVISFDTLYNRITTDNKAYFFNDSFDLEVMAEAIDLLSLDIVGCHLRAITWWRNRWSDTADQYARLFNGTARKNTPIFHFQ
ncbi:MAG: glycosyltransferase [Bacteroidota bacterium]